MKLMTESPANGKENFAFLEDGAPTMIRMLISTCKKDRKESVDGNC